MGSTLRPVDWSRFDGVDIFARHYAECRGGDFFDGVAGSEGGPEPGTEVFVVFLLFGLDAVIGGEEAEFGVIAGGFCFSFGGLRAGGGVGVFTVGVDLRFGGHGV